MFVAQVRAVKVEEQRREEEEESRKTSLSGARTLADTVRLKESEHRSAEEKQFVGLDLVLNPELYEDLPSRVAEEMQFDPNYQCDYTKEDLDRLLKLPEQVNLALPFLYSAKDVEVHRVLNKYLRQMDEEFFLMKDFKSDVAVEGAEEGADDAIGDGEVRVSPKDLEKAEAIHEILIKVT